MMMFLMYSFVCFGHNRNYIQKNAKKGPEGVGFLVSSLLSEEYEVLVLVNKHAGIFGCSINTFLLPLYAMCLLFATRKFNTTL